MNRAVCKLFEVRLGKSSFKFDSSTNRNELEPQFEAHLVNEPNMNLTVFGMSLYNLEYV